MRLKIKRLMIVVLVFATIASCKNPNGPDEPSAQITVEIKYVRIAPITYGHAFELVHLSSQAIVPDSDYPDVRVQEMTKVSDDTFVMSIAVWTNYTTTIWVTDGWLYQPQDTQSYQYVAKDLYVNGRLMARSTSKGSPRWCGTVKFIIKNDGSIVQP